MSNFKSFRDILKEAKDKVQNQIQDYDGKIQKEGLYQLENIVNKNVDRFLDSNIRTQPITEDNTSTNQSVQDCVSACMNVEGLEQDAESAPPPVLDMPSDLGEGPNTNDPTPELLTVQGEYVDPVRTDLSQLQSYQVTVPFGVVSGQKVQFDVDGHMYQVNVPDGLSAGDKFSVNVPITPSAQPSAPQPSALEPESAVEEPESAVEEPESAVEEPEPAVEEPEPAVEEPEPAPAPQRTISPKYRSSRNWSWPSSDTLKGFGDIAGIFGFRGGDINKYDNLEKYLEFLLEKNKRKSTRRKSTRRKSKKEK